MNYIDPKYKKAQESYTQARIEDRKVQDLYLKDQIFSKNIPMTLKRHNFKDKYGVRISPYFSKTDVIISTCSQILCIDNKSFESENRNKKSSLYSKIRLLLKISKIRSRIS